MINKAIYFLNITFLVIFLTVGFVAKSQIRVEKIPDTIKAGNGIVFCLPQTRVQVEVIVEKAILTKGDLSEFSSEFLGTNEIISENKTVYAIKDIVVSTYSEPDVTQYYLLVQKPSLLGIRKVSRVNLTPGGMLHSINWRNEECNYEQTMPSVRAFNWDHLAPRQENPSYFTYHLNTNILNPQKVVLPSTDSSAFIPEAVSVVVDTPKQMSTRDKARESAQELARIRDSKEKLLSGYQEISYEKGTLQLMANQLQQMEEQLLRQFKGSRETEILRYEYSCVPKEKQENNIELFRFSSSKGILANNSNEGDIVALGFITGKKGAYTGQEIKGKRKGFGIPFRMPNTAECIIYFANEEVFRSRITIAQFGEVARLPEKIKRVLFYPETGGIKSLLKD